jgi:hypothetical protein
LLQKIYRYESPNKSATGKRAQIRNHILVRQKEIVAELAKGWSVRAILGSLNRKQRNNMQLQNLRQTRAPLAGQSTYHRRDYPKKRKAFQLGANTE